MNMNSYFDIAKVRSSCYNEKGEMILNIQDIYGKKFSKMSLEELWELNWGGNI